MSGGRLGRAAACLMLGLLLAGPVAWAQESKGAPATSQPPPPKDALGRDTPRGTVLGFMSAARNGRNDVTPQYLNTRLRDEAAVELAHQLFVVLDSRLPPRLSELSDRPEGSLANPLKPDQDVVGTITAASGPLDLVVERVNVRGSGPVWLFSRATLDGIPDAYGEINLVSVDRFLPAFLTRHRVAGIRLFEWLALALIFPVSYRLWGLLGRLLRPPLVWWRRRRGLTGALPATLVPGSVRLLLLAVAIRWLLGSVELPLPERVFWSAIATMLAIYAIAWALLVSNGVVERYTFRRLQGAGHAEVAAMLRLARRFADGLVIATGGLVTLYYFGVDPTAALAGLGIGGIAVALAAQKTLENVIGGLSIIFDKAVRVGDFLKLGETVGSVDYIGLRSTRIRTMDRTILSVPNGQIANVNIETLSARDKFWFRHVVGLRYETTPAQVRAIIDGIRAHLTAHPAVDRTESIRVRFFRLGPFSLDVEVFAYITAADWEGFLETQQDLLLAVMEIVGRAGAVIALPSQTVHVADADARRGARQGPDRWGPIDSTGGAPPERGIQAVAKSDRA
jgi:MscS family membrane protein